MRCPSPPGGGEGRRSARRVRWPGAVRVPGPVPRAAGPRVGRGRCAPRPAGRGARRAARRRASGGTSGPRARVQGGRGRQGRGRRDGSSSTTGSQPTSAAAIRRLNTAAPTAGCCASRRGSARGAVRPATARIPRVRETGSVRNRHGWELCIDGAAAAAATRASRSCAPASGADIGSVLSPGPRRAEQVPRPSQPGPRMAGVCTGQGVPRGRNQALSSGEAELGQGPLVPTARQAGDLFKPGPVGLR